VLFDEARFEATRMADPTESPTPREDSAWNHPSAISADQSHDKLDLSPFGSLRMVTR
jgi:hypothetical protein